MVRGRAVDAQKTYDACFAFAAEYASYFLPEDIDAVAKTYRPTLDQSTSRARDSKCIALRFRINKLTPIVSEVCFID